jgi:hypothetical protein
VSGCYDAQIIRRLTAFRLDACGAIPLFATDPVPALKGLEDAIQNVTRTRNVDQPADNVVKTVKGGVCDKPRGTPTDRGWQYSLTFCGQNPLFENITGYKTLDYSGSEIIGWEDIEITAATAVALEIVFEPTTDDCAGGNPQCRALLVSNLEAWVRSGDEAWDGENVPDLVEAGQTRKSVDVFGNYATSGELPAYLTHWTPKFAHIKTGRSWSYTYLINCPDVDTYPQDPCRFAALDSES